MPITFSLMFVFASMFFGPSFAVAQSIATVRMRAVSASVLLFIQTIIGLTLGPALVGRISDYLAADGRPAFASVRDGNDRRSEYLGGAALLPRRAPIPRRPSRDGEAQRIVVAERGPSV